MSLKTTDHLTIQNSQSQTEVVTSAFALNIQAFKEPPRDRKAREKDQHSGSNTIDEMVIIDQDVAVIFSQRTFWSPERSCGVTVQSVGCKP
ncbi:unnamed protein product [Gulo gulo]|uniref:Uncharacterized protein n=1 Tax=Gulo gulo TaxID=48420 RepID=A0A9X9M209_GULGU|nr:unnamed protein product [Gulo gulo]